MASARKQTQVRSGEDTPKAGTAAPHTRGPSFHTYAQRLINQDITGARAAAIPAVPAAHRRARPVPRRPGAAARRPDLHPPGRGRRMNTHTDESGIPETAERAGHRAPAADDYGVIAALPATAATCPAHPSTSPLRPRRRADAPPGPLPLAGMLQPHRRLCRSRHAPRGEHHPRSTPPASSPPRAPTNGTTRTAPPRALPLALFTSLDGSLFNASGGGWIRAESMFMRTGGT